MELWRKIKANKVCSEQIKTVFLKQQFASFSFPSDTDVFTVSRTFCREQGPGSDPTVVLRLLRGFLNGGVFCSDL